MDRSEAFQRIWTAFDAGQILPACAWCGRVRIDETWISPSSAALAAIDQRYTFSHSVCDACADLLSRKEGRTLSVAPAQAPTHEDATGRSA